jgi:hypothetical protein
VGVENTRVQAGGVMCPQSLNSTVPRVSMYDGHVANKCHIVDGRANGAVGLT